MNPARSKLRGAALLASFLTIVGRAETQPYSSPVGCENCIGFWYYLDQGNTQDWDCKGRTYADHNGSDYSLRGGNRSIDNDGNNVLAAAAGVVIIASDGNYDRCTSCGGSGCGTNTPGAGFSNYVVIDHGGQNTTYGHMKNGSVKVQVGDQVACGQVIGQIGSAGCSSGAHLHFQPRPKGGDYRRNPLDPYAGDCSPTSPSLWGEQAQYLGMPGSTCDDAPPPQCPPETFEIWTCTEDDGSRRRCVGGVDSIEQCEWGCAEMPQGTDDVCALPADDDGDGSRADTDCDDTRSDVHPGALEVCGDAVDQDCSGSDEICPPATGGAASAAAGATGQEPSVSNGGTAAAGTSQPNGGAPATSGAGGSAVEGLGEPAAGSAASPSGSGGQFATPTPANGAVDAGCACRLGTSHPQRKNYGWLYAWLVLALAYRGRSRRRTTPQPDPQPRRFRLTR